MGDLFNNISSAISNAVSGVTGTASQVAGEGQNLAGGVVGAGQDLISGIETTVGQVEGDVSSAFSSNPNAVNWLMYGAAAFVAWKLFFSGGKKRRRRA
jgi:hypothetical protein